MKITRAQARKDGDFTRLFVTLDGEEYIAPVSKPFVLIQRTAELPLDYPAGEPFVVFVDPADEDSEPLEILHATRDPVYVHVCREFRADPLSAKSIKIPTVAEAEAARWEATEDGFLRRL